MTRAELGPLAPPNGTHGPDLSGSWVPGALWEWARGLTYYREPAGDGRAGELVASLPFVIMLGGGDCDDVAASVATMAKALGFPVAIGRLTSGPRFAHIIAAMSQDWTGRGPWVIVDPQMDGLADPRDFPGVRWFPV